MDKCTQEQKKKKAEVNSKRNMKEPRKKKITLQFHRGYLLGR